MFDGRRGAGTGLEPQQPGAVAGAGRLIERARENFMPTISVILGDCRGGINIGLTGMSAARTPERQARRRPT